MVDTKKRCSKPGCGALVRIGNPCTDYDCPQRYVEAADYRAAEDRATAAEAAIARLRDEVVEECAGVADVRADAWTESGNFMGDGYGDGAHATAKEIAATLRALTTETHRETR